MRLVMQDERRRYFRIEDIVVLTVTPIQKHELDKRLEQFWTHPHEYSISNEYNLQLEQQVVDFHAIKAKMPELARYLSVQQKQIDLLNQKLSSTEEVSSHPPKQVNLSAQGILFNTNDKLNADDIVDLHLELGPGGHKMSIFARVIDIRNNTSDDQDAYQVSFDFEHIHDVDREALVKHIHSFQLRENTKNKRLDIPEA